MGNIDARERFFEGVNAFRVADEKARSGRIEAKAFKTVIVDLDAVIPGVSGVMLGRALLLKASCLYWLHFDKLAKGRSILFDLGAPPDPLLKEGLSCAMRGRKILEELGSIDLPWANDVVKKFVDLGGN